jgi:hypothetical protein
MPYNEVVLSTKELTRMRRPIVYAPALVAGILLIASSAVAQQRAMVAYFVNTSRDRHETVVATATDAVAVELAKRGLYEVVTKQETDKAARERGVRPPFSQTDLLGLAKDLEATLIVTGEVHHVESRTNSDRQREIEVGLIIRVKDIASGEMVNGAAERGVVIDPGRGQKTDGELAIEAAAQAARRIGLAIGDHKPIEGTILNSAGGGSVVLNRGASHGVKGKQEFLVFRAGERVGRVKAGRVYASYTELTVVDNGLGIRPQDKVVSIFPEPKFPSR